MTPESSPPATAVPDTLYDVLVIGGGPGGSTVAPLLAQKGYKVALLEKSHHPRFHIGESLLPANLPLLDELGVGDEIRAIGVPKHGAEFVSPWHEAGSQTFQFADAWDKSMPSAFQVLRSEFDEILFRNATRKGVHTVEGCKVTAVDLDSDPERVTVQARHDDGSTSQWQARFLVDASGRDTFLSNKFRIKHPNKKHNSTAVYAHFTGARRHEGKAEGNITIFWFDYGWFWFIPLQHGVTSVGMVTWPHYLKTRGGRSLEQFLLDTIATCPPLAKRLEQAQIHAHVTATGNFSYVSERNHGRNYVMLGDAYAFIDPVFSSGVWLAMKGGVFAAEAIDTLLAQPARRAAALRKFDRQMRHGPREFSWFIYRVTNPTMRDMFMSPSDKYRMKEALLSMLAGDIYGKTPIWSSIRILKGAYYLLSTLNYKRTYRAWKKRRNDIVAIPGLLPNQTEY
ncbi:MAG: NAD(P)/FAD-dependent oxidoreductase [Brachymonas denitrificans]|uniref:NAD(P)/FAD-dependent oxidoreductase n=1 Tax=Brachymonas denitrificans TaxID=28220 RepID=UPI00352D646B